MNTDKNLNVCFMGAKQAGVVGFLVVLSKKVNVLAAVSYSPELTDIIKLFKIPLYNSIYNKEFIEMMQKSDLLISVHGREIVSKELLNIPVLGAINVHPYLYKYKGGNPVGKALSENNFKASVGVHKMTEMLDEGEVIVEQFLDTTGSKSVGEIYNKLYPYYASALLRALKTLEESKRLKI